MFLLLLAFFNLGFFIGCILGYIVGREKEN